ncbi:MAG: hypothetical protein M0Z59_03600 [Nitrospiraceae bacterium]|nr:hypothetical protein [Nitrospiraceae bacterium]
MNVIKMMFLFSGALLVFANPVLARNPVYPGNGIFTVMLGYDGGWLDYKEKNKGAVIDRDTGWLNGANASIKYENTYFFMKGLFEFSGSSNATYNGALQDGTPMRMRTWETFYRYEADLGYKLIENRAVEVAPYAGIGYRDWERGDDVLPDYRESYTWPYGAFGVACTAFFENVSLGVDAAVQTPFDMRMETNVAGTVDKAAFNLGSKPGYRVELPVTYMARSSGNIRGFLFLTPYYQHWAIGKSPDVVLTKNGIPVDTAFEPDSTTDMYGAKAGVGFSF